MNETVVLTILISLLIMGSFISIFLMEIESQKIFKEKLDSFNKLDYGRAIIHGIENNQTVIRYKDYYFYYALDPKYFSWFYGAECSKFVVTEMYLLKKEERVELDPEIKLYLKKCIESKLKKNPSIILAR